jgi:TolB protein
VRAWGPRVSGTSLFYLSAQGTADGLWRYRDEESVEIWRGSQGELSDPAAPSPDGLQAAIVLQEEGRLTLRLVETDGSRSRTLGEAIEIHGTPGWSPDGSWVVASGEDGHGRGLFKIPVAGGPPIRLVSGVATNPSWSPKGDLILYKGGNVGGQAPLLGVRPDGGGVELPVVETTGADLRFLPDGSGAVFVRGGLGVPQAFWLLDVSDRTFRRLTEFPADPKLGKLRRFDISSDGKHIIFDRLIDNSDIVLIDLPRRQ